MSAPDASEMSKSARKRANQKARTEAEAAEQAPAPAPAPKAKAAGKAAAKAAAVPAPEPAQAKAKAKGKAKAEPKAAAAPEPAPTAEPKSKAKAKAKAGAAAAAPAAAVPQPEAKANAKKKAKKEKAEAEAPVKPVVEEVVNYEIDDGTGGDWDVASGLSSKASKRKEKAEAQRKAEEEEKKALKAAGAGKNNQHIPGMASPKEIVAAAKAKSKGGDIVVAKVSDYKATAPSAAKAPEPVAEKPADNLISASIKVPQEKIGRVIGPKGANIILIKEKTGVNTVDTADGLVTIVGDDAAGVKLAEHAVNELISKGYMSLSFDDFKEEGLSVNPYAIPDIIGQRGAIIQIIKKECKVEVDIGDSKNLKPGQKVKVSIAGGAEGVAKAQEIINSIAAFSHHEVTHPGFAHVEMEVEEWKYRFLIGKGGSEMRHIQNNYKVKVNIPRENSTTDKVVVIGEERDVERCVKYIEKILSEAEQPKGRETADKAEDTWGAEEPEEAWMSPYMYKRR